MATAPSVTISAVSSGVSATRPIKTIDLSNTYVTVGDPIETTVSYYTGPRSSQATLSNLALQLTTDTSGTLSTHYVEYGNSVQYNQSIGLRCVASNSSGLSSEDIYFVYNDYVFFPVPKVTSIETDNGDNTITTVFTLEFDNGAAETSVKVQYRSASGHITSYTSSAWSSWTTSNQETIATGNTGTQIIHYTVTTASNAEMSFNFRLTTGSSWASFPDYSRNIFYANPNVHLYGSVNGQTKEIKKLYGSVNGQTKEIKKLYGSVNGQTKLIYEKRAGVGYGTVYYKANASDPDSAIQSAELQSVTEFNSLVYQDIFHTSWTALIDNGSVTVSNDSTNVVVGISIGRLITAIPDNFLGFCSYLTQPIIIPDGVSTIGDAFLYSCSNFNSPITIPGTVTSIGGLFLGFCRSFNQPISIPSDVTSIGDSFLGFCASYNQAIVIPGNVITIGQGFMLSCTSFNSSLTLSNGLTSIGRMFMSSCTSFNQNIVLPSTLTKIDTADLDPSFLWYCNNFTSTVNVGSLSADIIKSDTFSFSPYSPANPAYTTGITIAGANRAAWLSKFPNSQTTPYRKLIDAGY